MKPNQTKEKLLVFMLLVLLLEAIFFYTESVKIQEQKKQEIAQSQILKASLDQVPLLARAVSAYDVEENKKIYGRNDEVALPIASLAKIMTIVVALNQHKDSDVITISSSAIKQTGDYGLKAGERWNIDDLAKFTLINSVNDGAYAIALLDGGEKVDQSFLAAMNEKARKIGASNTTFLNVTGLDFDDSSVGAFASAQDVNTMAIYAMKDYPEVFRATILPEIKLVSDSGLTHTFKNTDTIIDKIPNIIFSKTGFTDIAGGNLTIIFKNKNGHRIAVTLLGSTMDGRFEDMEKIVNFLYNS